MKDNTKELNHLAVIMDGNGRWATEKGLDRTNGHAAGEHSLSRTIDWSIKNKILWLTVYAFSTENWLRSIEEVEYLMFFNRDILLRRREEFNEKGVRFRFLGNLEDNKIPEENKCLMIETEELTKSNNILNLLSYLLIIVLLALPQMGQATGFPFREYFVNGRFFILFFGMLAN